MTACGRGRRPVTESALRSNQRLQRTAGLSFAHFYLIRLLNRRCSADSR